MPHANGVLPLVQKRPKNAWLLLSCSNSCLLSRLHRVMKVMTTNRACLSSWKRIYSVDKRNISVSNTVYTHFSVPDTLFRRSQFEKKSFGPRHSFQDSTIFRKRFGLQKNATAVTIGDLLFRIININNKVIDNDNINCGIAVTIVGAIKSIPSQSPRHPYYHHDHRTHRSPLSITKLKLHS